LVRRRAQNIAKSQRVGPLCNAAGVGPTAAKFTLRHAQVLKIIGAQRGKPSHFGTHNVGTFDLSLLYLLAHFFRFL
jgi:hypothetical protein